MLWTFQPTYKICVFYNISSISTLSSWMIYYQYLICSCKSSTKSVFGNSIEFLLFHLFSPFKTLVSVLVLPIRICLVWNTHLFSAIRYISTINPYARVWPFVFLNQKKYSNFQWLGTWMLQTFCVSFSSFCFLSLCLGNFDLVPFPCVL